MESVDFFFFFFFIARRMEGRRDKRRTIPLDDSIGSERLARGRGGGAESRGGEMISKREICRGGGKRRADVWEFGVIAHDRPCECNLIVASDAVNATAERGAESTNDKKKSA